MGLTRDRVLQRLTFQIFHSDKGSAIFFTDIVNGANVGVVESGSSVRFALEARERLRVAGDIFEQEFERDKAVEAKVLCLVDHAHAQAAARVNPHWRRRYMHLAMRRHKSIAKVAMGRRMAVRLYWMWRNSFDYSPSLEFGSYAGQLGTRNGVK